MEDIVFHGSLASQYYDDESDLDLQIIIDFDKVDLMKIDFSGWEGVAIEDGWPVITDVLYEYEGEVE